MRFLSILSNPVHCASVQVLTSVGTPPNSAIFVLHFILVKFLVYKHAYNFMYRKYLQNLVKKWSINKTQSHAIITAITSNFVCVDSMKHLYFKTLPPCVSKSEWPPLFLISLYFKILDHLVFFILWITLYIYWEIFG